VTSGYNNTGLGYNTLSDTTGSQNVAIGANAGSTLTTGSNNIVIGVNGTLPSNTSSNQLNIGNWIYGNNGNIGVGTSNIDRRLNINSISSTTKVSKIQR
jgi:hypothetical protein